MAKLSDRPIGPEDLREYLEGQDDFALELFAYRTAKECGLAASHGGSYQDPVTRKMRQYDVRAAIERGNRRIDLALECKGLSNAYPLLVSRVPRPEEDSYHEVIHAHVPRTAGPVMPGVDTVDVPRAEGDHSIYRPGMPVGKSTTQVGRNERGDLKTGDVEVYDKWSQALASASDLIARAGWAHDERGLDSFWTVVLPVLVVSDGTLWVADYTADGQLESDPCAVPEATVFVGYADRVGMGPWYTMSHLHVLTRDHLEPFLTSLVNVEGRWGWLFSGVQ